MKTSLGYPDHAATVRILEGSAAGKREVGAVITPEAVQTLSQIAQDAYLNPLVLDYIARVIEATRQAAQVRLGVSVRGALALTRASRTWALAHGRGYVTPDDVKALAEPVLAHRLILDPEAEFDGVTAGAVIGQVMLDVAPPTQRESA
jgi:MoxR-like ATPase